MSATDDPVAAPEPSMEEILASIRRIIADDSAERATGGTPVAAPGGASQGDDEVLVLTDMVVDDGSVVSLTGDQRPAPMAEPVAPRLPDPSAPAREEFMSPDQGLSAGLSELQRQTLLSDRVAAVSTAALSQLSSAFPRPSDPSAGKTIEEVVKEAVTPMLREWLDANLSIIVERLVRREIERLVRRAEENV